MVTRLMATVPTAYDATGPAYLIGEDAGDRVTYVVRPMAEQLGFLDRTSLAPHGICLLWRPELIWTHVVSDAIIAFAYFTIPVALGVFVTRRRDIAFGWMFWAFALFILACGTTHLFGIWTLWVPDYAAEAVIKAITAAASK